MTDKNTCGDDYLDCNPGAANLGDTMTVQPREWTPLDNDGTQIYLYGDSAVDIAVQERPELPPVSFHDIDGVTTVRVGAQRVVRLPSDDHQAINAVVDVLEALGIHGERVTN